MLWFEREVVGALTESPDQPLRSSVEAFVDGYLRDMPEHLRAGVAGESVLLGTYVAALRRTGRIPSGDAAALTALVDKWETSRIGVLRSYAKVMKSMVLLAENELAPAGGA
jgi:hypothetical protein